MTMREKIARAMADLGDLDDWPNWLDLADAALAALEEPTEGMSDAGCEKEDLGWLHVWRAMIAAAKEG